MVIAARSKSIHGPWVDCPHNPLLRTESKEEPWWSRGHASFVEGPAGDWWMVYHAYENGFRTLGRQVLLEAVDWVDDWPVVTKKDLAAALPSPRQGTPGLAGFPLSASFVPERLGVQWSLYGQRPASPRLQFRDGQALLAGAGSSVETSPPLAMLVGDRDYEVEASLETQGSVEAALLLYYSSRGYCGLGVSDGSIRTHMYSQHHSWMTLPPVGSRVRIRLRNADQVATWWTQAEGGPWVKHPWQMEVSGLNHNVFGGFTALKVALLAIGDGTVVWSDFTYRGLRSR
jgi:xylan 1,4-beta-xylosidase